MRLEFDGGAVLVAGGSGGIGSAIVSQLAGSGLAVGLTYSAGRQTAERLAADLEGGGAKVACFSWSGSTFGEAAELVEQVRARLGPIASLVVASGIGQESAFHALAEEEAHRLVDTNLAAAIALCRAVILPMMRAGAGRIVLIGSVSGSRGIRGHTVYAATKAGLGGLARALAQEAGGFGVTVNCVAPGFVETPMIRAMTERARQGWLKRIPLGRLGEPADVAALVAFLLSKQAAYVTGQTLVVDGGISL